MRRVACVRACVREYYMPQLKSRAHLGRGGTFRRLEARLVHLIEEPIASHVDPVRPVRWLRHHGRREAVQIRHLGQQAGDSLTESNRLQAEVLDSPAIDLATDTVPQCLLDHQVRHVVVRLTEWQVGRGEWVGICSSASERHRERHKERNLRTRGERVSVRNRPRRFK